MWVRDYSGVPGESTDVVAEVVNLIDDQGNVIGASNPLPTSGSVSVLNPFTVDVISGSVSAIQTGTWTVQQGTPPWAVSGSVISFPYGVQGVSGSVSVLNPVTTVTANQGGAPWTASVQGQLPVTQATSPWLVSQSGSPWGASVQGTVVSTQGTSPWVVGQSGAWTASVQGQLPVTQATSPWLVSQSGSPWGASVQGTVVTTQGTSPWVTSGSVSAIQTGSWTVQQGTPPWSVSQSGSPWGASVQGTIVATEGGTWSVELLDSAGANKGSINAAGALLNGATSASVLPAEPNPAANVSLMSDKYGRLVTIPYMMRDQTTSQDTIITNTTAASVVVSQIASTFNDISSIVLSNTSATATLCTLTDGTNNYHYYVPGGDMRGAAYNVPLPATAINTTWTLATATAVTSLYCTIVYIKNK